MNNTNKKVERFFTKYNLVEYKTKEIVIHMSEKPSGIYYVKKGFVKMNTISTDGSELTLNIFKAGSFFPAGWALTNTPNNYLFQTITKTYLYKAPKKDVLLFLKNNQDVLFDLSKRVFSGVDRLMANITRLVFGNASNRVASALLLCSKRFGSKESKGEIVINIHLTHQDIANIAGLTRETTSVEISKLKKESIITQDKDKIVISDPRSLRKRAQI